MLLVGGGTYGKRVWSNVMLVSRGQPLPLDEGKVWSTDIDRSVRSGNNRKLVGVKC